MYKGDGEKNMEIQARVVIQVSSTPELPGERGKMLAKNPIIRFYTR